ncbi:MAG: hypothetical protein DME19_15630 [Verrucomicrobia bacterium]|nr:MAG: hypothetical protein DME19_15630 [Verrucomicrobiota bacterium]
MRFCGPDRLTIKDAVRAQIVRVDPGASVWSSGERNAVSRSSDGSATRLHFTSKPERARAE